MQWPAGRETQTKQWLWEWDKLALQYRGTWCRNAVEAEDVAWLRHNLKLITDAHGKCRNWSLVLSTIANVSQTLQETSLLLPRMSARYEYSAREKILYKVENCLRLSVLCAMQWSYPTGQEAGLFWLKEPVANSIMKVVHRKRIIKCISLFHYLRGDLCYEWK